MSNLNKPGEIEYFIRMKAVLNLENRLTELEKVTGQPVVFKGFEFLKFCIRQDPDSDMNNPSYVVDEMSTGFAISKRKHTCKETIDAVQKQLTQKGIGYVKKSIAGVIAEYGRANKTKRR